MLKIGIGGVWKSLHPGLQHTVWAGLVLSNQFETLVGTDERGSLIPLGAKSWSISDDFRRFEFKIDTSHHFSDGSPLTAMDFKTSWEESLRLVPQSANNSLQDLTYRLEGYSDFQKTGSLSGIQVTAPDTLILHMTEPVRMTLEYLSGIRFAAFKEKNGKLLGSGRYVIRQVATNILMLDPNPCDLLAKDLEPIQVEVVMQNEVKSALSEGRIDAVGYTMGHWLKSTLMENKKITVVPGPEAIHLALMVNGQKPSIFSDRHLRLALQYMLLKRIQKDADLLGAPDYLSVDPQIYLPVQPGRLLPDEANQIIKQGEQYVSKLVEASKQHPIVYFTSPAGNWVREELASYGVSFSPLSREPGHNEYYDTVYHGSNYDLIYWTFSVVNGDPDGIYHALGRHGSILCPVSFRATVDKLLEQGRSILNPALLDEHYKNVSREVLEQVPFVHLGFSKAVSIFANDRVKQRFTLMRRNYGNLDTFEAL